MDLLPLLGLIWAGIVPAIIVVLLFVNIAVNNMIETYQTARSQPKMRVHLARKVKR